jgi:hypothetical protein
MRDLGHPSAPNSMAFYSGLHLASELMGGLEFARR